MERSEHNLSVRTYPHTNWRIAFAKISIGVGVKFADALNIKDVKGYNLCRSYELHKLSAHLRCYIIYSIL